MGLKKEHGLPDFVAVGIFCNGHRRVTRDLRSLYNFRDDGPTQFPQS